MLKKRSYSLTVALCLTYIPFVCSAYSQKFKLPDIQIPIPDVFRPDLPKLPNPKEWSEIQTNQARIRGEIRNGWQSFTRFVVFGQEIDHNRQGGMAAAIGASIAAGNPGPAIGYIETLATEQKAAFQRNAKGEAYRAVQQVTHELLMRAFQDKLSGFNLSYNIGFAEIHVGIATYSHWKRVITDYPRIDRGRIKWKRYEKKISLPNTFEPYIRISLPIQQAQHHETAKPPVHLNRIDINNPTPNPITFGMSVNGGAYTHFILPPGQARWFTGTNFQMVFDSSFQPGAQNRSYRIRPGSYNDFRIVPNGIDVFAR